jgi:hypothetical protein
MVAASCFPAANILPWPAGDGNCVSLKSVEADSKLLCKSSKLTEGKKSNEALVSLSPKSAKVPFRGPKENRE